MLSHANLISNLFAGHTVINVDENDVSLSFLPLSHSFERLAAYLFLAYGVTMVFAESMDTIARDMLTVRPTVMTGVPSIIMGLFIFTIWVIPKGQSGVNAFAGALALACLMLPIVIRSTEEILRLVPGGLREASLALGASRARTIITVVLPAAVPGITSGALLAVARAAGETAPLLFTIGAARKVNEHVFSGANTALSTQIFRNAQLPFAGAQERAWGAALTLIVLVVVLTIVARLVTKRFSVPIR